MAVDQSKINYIQQNLTTNTVIEQSLLLCIVGGFNALSLFWGNLYACCVYHFSLCGEGHRHTHLCTSHLPLQSFFNEAGYDIEAQPTFCFGRKHTK